MIVSVQALIRREKTNVPANLVNPLHVIKIIADGNQALK